MDKFIIPRKRRRLSTETRSGNAATSDERGEEKEEDKIRPARGAALSADNDVNDGHGDDDDSTELKLAMLASLHPQVEQTLLLDMLLAHDGSVDGASQTLLSSNSRASRSGSSSSSISSQAVKPPKTKTDTEMRMDKMSRPPAPVASLTYQSSLLSLARPSTLGSAPGSACGGGGGGGGDDAAAMAASRAAKPPTRKGRTLHLYAPADVAAHTPCSIIHNFLPAAEADELLRELLLEARSFRRQTFKMFDNVVQSPHTACFYVDSVAEQQQQRTEYVYNGSYITDVRQLTPCMRRASAKVKTAVNDEITKRIKTHYPGGTKLRYQSPNEWTPNAAFVNCYSGGNESVGYHSDQLTYLGPRAVIGSLSLGVTREFRVRRVVPRDNNDNDNDKDSDGNGNNGNGDSSGGNKNALTSSSSPSSLPQLPPPPPPLAVAARQPESRRRALKHDDDDDRRADAEGQIAIHLPHNSLLVMHAEMQEEWKHSIAPAPAIDAHPVAGNKRINVTYRCYRDSFHPRFTPRCRCRVPTVLRCVQRKRENWGRYFWMCHAGVTPGKEGCSFFQWAEFDDDGEPKWKDQLPPPS